MDTFLNTPVTFAHLIGLYLWPSNWKPPTWHDRRHQLVKAGAMIVAEIERIDRLAMRGLDANMRPLQPRREPE